MIQNYVEEIQKHKRTIEDMTKKLAMQTIKFTQH